MKRLRFSRGFILPATVTLSMAILIISTTFAQSIISSSATLSGQSYKGLAQEAANSGIALAIGCFASGTSNWTTELTPRTICGGTSGASEYMAIAPDGSWRSTFEVAPPTFPSGNTKIISKGIIEVLSGNTKILTIEVYKGLTFTSTFDTTMVAQGEVLTDLSTDSHSCAIANGKLYCWGLNSTGQLGTANTTNANSPQLVAATNSGDIFYDKVVTSVAVGTGNTCAIASSQLYCWGDNAYGQLGNGSTGGTVTSPQLVSALSSRKITHFALSQGTAASKSACAIADGITYCWGSNSNQQLGQTVGSTVDTANRTTPTPVYGYRASDTASALLFGKKAQSVGIGAKNACQATVGKLYCWGNISNPTAAYQVRDMSSQGNYPYGSMVLPWSAKVVGDNSCSVTGYLICHGVSSAFGNNSSPDIEAWGQTITDYDGGENTASPGDGLYCVINADTYCNGTSNRGDGFFGVTASLSTAGRVVQKVGVGNRYGCQILNGGLACWGTVDEGQLADGNFTSSASAPKWVAESVIGNNNDTVGGTTYPRWTAWGPISTGANHSCALANGDVACWGLNSSGQLGTGEMTNQSQPTKITMSTLPSYNVFKEKVSAGGNHTCFIAARLYCMGSNTYGELGINSTTLSNRPAAVSGLSGRVSDVSAGPKNTCAVAGSQLYCWGDNSFGQLGNGATGPQRLTPQLVSAFAGRQVSAVAVGTNHVCAIVNGDGYCWGSNASYATGINTNAGNTLSPLAGKLNLGTAGAVTNNVQAAFTAISAGEDYSCAIINGATSCWGRNGSGQTGTGSLIDVPYPTLIAGPTGAMQTTAISTGATHACATINGAIYCWGNQDGGRLGNNNLATSQPPIDTPLLIDGGATVGRATINVSAGDSTSCSVSNGLILCWGAGTFGQIGDAAFSNAPVPTGITGYRTTGTSTRGQIY